MVYTVQLDIIYSNFVKVYADSKQEAAEAAMEMYDYGQIDETRADVDVEVVEVEEEDMD